MPHKISDEEIANIISKLSNFDLAKILEFRTGNKYTVIDKKTIRETLFLTKEIMAIIENHVHSANLVNKNLKAKWQNIIRTISY